MTDSIEERLIAALAARAELVTADSLRPEHPRPRRARPFEGFAQRLAPLGVAAGVIVAALLAAVGFKAWPGSHTETGDAPGTVATLEGVTLTVPAGWAYRLVAEGVGCVQPEETAPAGGECTPQGVEVRVGAFVGWPANGLDRDDGWSLTADACDGAGGRLTGRQTTGVGGQDADYRVWQVRCGTDPEFTVRLWWVPDAELTLYTRGLDESYDSTVDRVVACVVMSGAKPTR